MWLCRITVSLFSKPLEALRGRLADDDVSCLIDFCFQSVAFAEALQVLNHFFLVLRRTRYLVDFRKLFEHTGGF